jgi:hypothetical protein
MSSVASPVKYVPSGPIVVTQNNQIIQYLDIIVPLNSTVAGVFCNGFSNVTVRNCNIMHLSQAGISFINSPYFTIENCNIKYTGQQAINSVTPGGNMANPNINCLNVSGSTSVNCSINYVRVENGSSGIYLNGCDNAVVTMLQGVNMRGPGPRGQLIQFNTCLNPYLADFSNYNDPANSFSEDCVSIFASPNWRVLRGVLDGNNSPTGCGLMAEAGSPGGVVADVDCINMGNGSVFFYPAANCVCLRNRTMNNTLGDPIRGKNSSNALVYGGNACTGCVLSGCVVYNLVNPNNLLYDPACFVLTDVVTQSFIVRPQLNLTF